MNRSDLSALEQKWSQALSCPPQTPCLEAADLDELSRKGRRTRGYDAKMNHVALCGCCSDTLRAIKATSPKRISWPVFVLAPTAAAVLAVSLFIASNDRKPANNNLVKKPPVPSITDVKPKDVLVKKDTPPKVVVPQTPAEKWRMDTLVAMNDNSYREGSTQIASYVERYAKGLRNTPSVMRSGGESNGAVKLIQPSTVNSALHSVPKSFTWEPVAGTTGYEVRLEVDGAEVEVKVNENTATAVDMPKGDKIKLMVTPILDPETVDAVDPTESVFFFEVLNRSQRRDAAWADKNRKSAPLTASKIYSDLGLYRESLRTLPKVSDSRLKNWTEAMRRRANNRKVNPAEK